MSGHIHSRSTYKHSLRAHIYLNSFLANYNLQMSFYNSLNGISIMHARSFEIDVFTNFISFFFAVTFRLNVYIESFTIVANYLTRRNLFHFLSLHHFASLFHLETLDKNWGGRGRNTGAMAARLGKFNLVTETGVERAGRKKWNRGVSDNAVGQHCFASIVARTASVSNKGWRTKQVRQVEGCD